MAYVKSFIKWAGGKEKELPIILSNLPDKFERYIEPFVGGGSVYLNINCDKSIINDKSDELILLYNMIKNNNQKFIKKLKEINKNWILLEKIVENNSKKLNITLDKVALQLIAACSRGTPRIANRILRRVRDFSLVKGETVISEESVKKSLSLMVMEEKLIYLMLLDIMMESMKVMYLNVKIWALKMFILIPVKTLEHILKMENTGFN